MSPPNLGPVEGNTNWCGDGDINTSPLGNNATFQPNCNDYLAQALQGMKMDSLLAPTLDLSANNSLLDLSEGIGEDEWLLSASLAGSLEGRGVALELNEKEWFGRHPSQEMCEKEKKLLLVEMLDGIADHPSIEADNVFISPQYSLPKNFSIQKIMISHENSLILPLPSFSLDRLAHENTKPGASTYLEAHLHSPTLSDHPLSPTHILSLTAEESSKAPSAANLTFDSLQSPPNLVRSHSPPWPQLISTPTGKPSNLAKSWQPVVTRLGQIVPPEFEPKLEFSPPESRCHNTTETKISIHVQDVDATHEASTDSNHFNITRTKETPMNTTQPIAPAQANTTQTLGDYPANTTQTLGDCPANTTQTLGEGPANTTQTLGEGIINTTQTYEETSVNTTQTIETVPTDVTTNVLMNTTETFDKYDNIGNVSESMELNSQGNVVTKVEIVDPVNTTEIDGDNIDLGSATTVTTNNLHAMSHSSTTFSDERSSSPSDLCSNGTDLNKEIVLQTNLDPSDNSLRQHGYGNNDADDGKETLIDDETTFQCPGLAAIPSEVEEEPRKKEFVRNSSFTGTYRVSPMLDSKGKRLPGPGRKAGVKKPAVGGVRQSGDKPNFQLPKYPKVESKPKPTLKRSVSMRPNISSVAPSMSVKMDLKRGIVSKSVKPKVESTPNLSSIKSIMSVQLKTPSTGLPLHATLRSNSAENLKSTQMNPPLIVPPKPTVLHTHQASKLQPLRFQSRMAPLSSLISSGPGQAFSRPAASGIRPPAARSATSGIARLAGRQSFSASRLPMPGK